MAAASLQPTPPRPTPDTAADEDIRAAVVAMMHDANVPGMPIAVARHDRLLFADAFGWADITDHAPATTSTNYLWFSMSKIVTATAAMRLADEGRLDLDAPVGQYLPWLHRRTGAQPTMRHLLTHTAGLSNPLPIRRVHPADRPAPDQETMLRRLLDRRRMFRHEPGGRARYTNIGYLAAAQVITTITGTPFQQHIVDAVLRPAGMTSTRFSYHAGAPAATGYIRAPRVADPLIRRTLPPAVGGKRHGKYLALRPFLVDGAGYGGLVGHVMDAIRLVRLHLGDGSINGHRVLSADSARAMRQIAATGTTFDHAIGWFRRPTGDDDEQYLEHFGTGAGFWNVMRLYPTKNLGIVAMSNSTTSYRFQPVFAFIADLPWP